MIYSRRPPVAHVAVAAPPPRWEAHHSDEGVFYHNNATGETRWTHPTGGAPTIWSSEPTVTAGGAAAEESAAAPAEESSAEALADSNPTAAGGAATEESTAESPDSNPMVVAAASS